ncbi:MAG: hypothetical protein R2792_19740 [Saprospiraceae bacterium]
MLLQLIPQVSYLDTLYIQLFSGIATLITTNNIQQEQVDYLQLLDRYKNDIDAHDLRNFHAYYRSFYASILQAHRSFAYQKLFDLYQAQLREGYIYYNNQILATLKLISNLGLKVGATEW